MNTNSKIKEAIGFLNVALTFFRITGRNPAQEMQVFNNYCMPIINKMVAAGKE